VWPLFHWLPRLANHITASPVQTAATNGRNPWVGEIPITTAERRFLPFNEHRI
jgi:hypothetical protein